MIFLHHAKLVILSQPKTGTTALDDALSERAAITLSSPPELKHLSYRKFLKFIAPLLSAQMGLGRQDYEVISVMREPLDWLGSWYRYRTRDGLKNKVGRGSPKYSGNITFDQFVREVCKPRRERASYARVGMPYMVAADGKESIGADRLFSYENLQSLYDLIEERSGRPVKTGKYNVSPSMALTLSDEAQALVKEKYAFSFELYRSLNRDGSIDARFRKDVAATDAAGDDA